MKFLVIIYTLCGTPHHIVTWEENTGFVYMFDIGQDSESYIKENYPLDQTDIARLPLDEVIEGQCS